MGVGLAVRVGLPGAFNVLSSGSARTLNPNRLANMTTNARKPLESRHLMSFVETYVPASEHATWGAGGVPGRGALSTTPTKISGAKYERASMNKVWNLVPGVGGRLAVEPPKEAIASVYVDYDHAEMAWVGAVRVVYPDGSEAKRWGYFSAHHLIDDVSFDEIKAKVTEVVNGWAEKLKGAQ